VSVVLVSRNVRKAPTRVEHEREGRRRETRVVRKGFHPVAKRRRDQQGTKKVEGGRGGRRNVLPRPLGDRHRHQTLVVAESEGTR
jgi:hypothetical protein